MTPDLELMTSLLAAPDYRDFLRQVFAFQHQKIPHFSFSYFSKKAGFSSRSFAREVLAGQKRISPKSLPKFLIGMELDKDLSEFFKILVCEQEPDCDERKQSARELAQQKEKIKHRLLKLKLAPVGDPSLPNQDEDFFSIRTWPIVYSCLGDDKGEPFEKIVHRSGLNRLDVRNALRGMMQKDMIHFDDAAQTYHAKDFHLVIKRLGSNQFFRGYFLDCLADVQKRALADFSAKDSLFMQSVFVIQKSKFPELRKALEALLTKFIDDSEIRSGDGVAQLSMGLLLRRKDPD